MEKQLKINREVRLLIKKSIADYLNDYICNHSGFNNITIASINTVSEKLSFRVCQLVDTNYKKFYFYNDTCNNCFWGQAPPICGKINSEIYNNGWCEYYERLVDEP